MSTYNNELFNIVIPEKIEQGITNKVVKVPMTEFVDANKELFTNFYILGYNEGLKKFEKTANIWCNACSYTDNKLNFIKRANTLYCPKCGNKTNVIDLISTIPEIHC